MTLGALSANAMKGESFIHHVYICWSAPPPPLHFCFLLCTPFLAFSFFLSSSSPTVSSLLSPPVACTRLLSPRCRHLPAQPQLLERLLEEIQHLKATVSSQEKRICHLENKLSQYANGTA